MFVNSTAEINPAAVSALTLNSFANRVKTWPCKSPLQRVSTGDFIDSHQSEGTDNNLVKADCKPYTDTFYFSDVASIFVEIRSEMNTAPPE